MVDRTGGQERCRLEVFTHFLWIDVQHGKESERTYNLHERVGLLYYSAYLGPNIRCCRVEELSRNDSLDMGIANGRKRSTIRPIVGGTVPLLAMTCWDLCPCSIIICVDFLKEVDIPVFIIRAECHILSCYEMN